MQSVLAPYFHLVCFLYRALLHDPEVYSEPEAFLPERFLKWDTATNATAPVFDPNVQDPMEAAFGFGRRICPGRYMAYESMWITIVSVLAMFDIERAKDADGKDIVPSEAYCDGFIRCVAVFVA